jgi:hypothetical protein
MTNIIAKYHNQVLDVISSYNVNYLALFGSHARDQAKPDSDIDLLVDYDKPIGLFRFAELQQQLSNVLGKKVDLVSRKGVSKHLKPFIENDLQVVYEKN